MKLPRPAPILAPVPRPVLPPLGASNLATASRFLYRGKTPNLRPHSWVA